MSNQLAQYAELLAAAADRLGLTSLRDPVRIEQELIADSLTAADLLAQGARVLDLGSGGGCPGIPLAITRSDLCVTLLEANGRKVGFLSDAVEKLGLKNVEVVKERSEFLARQPRYRAAYLAVVAKAVAPLRTLIELALPFLELEGLLIAYKGPGLEAELAQAATALQRVGGVHLSNRPYLLIDRHYVHCQIRKAIATPHEYPRRPGIPAHNPL